MEWPLSQLQEVLQAFGKAGAASEQAALRLELAAARVLRCWASWYAARTAPGGGGAPAPGPRPLPPLPWCPKCGAGEADSVVDPVTAEAVCTRCGCVVVDHMLFLGPSEREFEEDGGVSPEHAAFPDAHARLLSDQAALDVTFIRGGAGGGPRVRRAPPHYASDDLLTKNQTTLARRDRDKRAAVKEVEDAADRLRGGGRPHPPRAVVDSALDLYAHVRDTQEHVQAKSLAPASCLLVAWSVAAEPPPPPLRKRGRDQA